MPDSHQAEALAKIIWNYLRIDDKLVKADLILALGSVDTRVAERATDLFLKGYAPLLIFSGGLGRVTTGSFSKPEAELFADIAMAAGVPSNKIIIENKSSNTGDNIAFSFKAIEEQGIKAGTIILVTKPYMERRAYATLKKQFPDQNVLVTSPEIDFEHSAAPGFSQDDLIHILIGDMQRIKLYPDMGFQIPQEIPPQVWEAYQKLVALGYTKQLVKV